jgi:hypothetical protein
MLHDICAHIYIHHIGITILFSFLHIFILLGRLANLDPSRRTHFSILKVKSMKKKEVINEGRRKLTEF